MHETGCSGLVHWDDPEGWDGVGGGGGGFQDEEYMYTHEILFGKGPELVLIIPFSPLENRSSTVQN